MATTRIIPMHVNRGRTIAQCLSERTDYAKNPEKTNGGKLISAYACDQRTADNEFLFSKRQYVTITGKDEVNNVIAYQVRQSFKPGEVTPKEANKIGYEFASRFLKGKHAFIVCTHQDKSHVHNHIIWNSTTLDCTRKFRDFYRSGKAVARLSDQICIEHKLSVIENPQRTGSSYNKWLGNKAQPSHRELLRVAIDDALAEKPQDFDALLYLLEADGYTIKRGANITFTKAGQKQNIRMKSLGDGYSEDELRAVIAGGKKHTPKKRRVVILSNRILTVIDIQQKLADGKGEAYRRWATVENLKRMAKTYLYMEEHNLSYEQLAAHSAEVNTQVTALSKKVEQAQNRLVEIAALRKHIINYSKTRDVYVGYRKAGYSKAYLDEHEPDIIIHKASKKFFDEIGIKKLPTVKSLQVEYAELTAEKKEAYAELKKLRDEKRELAVHKANYEELRDLDEREQRKEKEHDRD